MPAVHRTHRLRLPPLARPAPRALVFVLGALAAAGSAAEAPAPVEIRTKGDGFELVRDGRPYHVKGAGGPIASNLAKVRAYGGNSVRVGADRAGLDRAAALGLTALVGLPVRAERDGADYDDPAAVRAQHAEVMRVVRELKDHPAVLWWALGNELDWIADGVDANWKVYDAVEALAREIKAADPVHPVMTVLGMSNYKKLAILRERAPSLDVLGMNAYGDIGEIPALLRGHGWTKPWVATEWGPTGFWQVPKTAWGAEIEETSSEKADVYRRRYETVIAAEPRCLGSYAFLWRQHQERTHTWFGMFDAAGNESETVGVMQYLWTGTWPPNRAPRVTGLTLDGRRAVDGVVIAPGKEVEAAVTASDPDRDPLRFEWEVLEEQTRFGYGGHGETKPPAVRGAVPAAANAARMAVRAPGRPGAYRLFVAVYDGQGHYGGANLPFQVR
jgi:hypothetical protein